jgi:class 3 adenylate cyclase/tetratricopeptide (TPR) repeat protein
MPSCPTCGADIPGGFAFCGRCGAPIAAAPLPLAEERKVVTVLFCDLVGFTARSDQADPEDVRARLRPYHARLRNEIERFGGTVEKFIGDAVMAAFGAPVTHEDDPERSVRAGLRILEAVEELNATDPGLDLVVRIGVNTGEAVVALGARPELGEGIVTGDVVNTAARLQAVAPVGAVVVGEPTWQATRRIFDYEPLPPVDVKGKAEPLVMWRVLATRSRFGVEADLETATPFLGREVELTLLQGVSGRALAEPSVQLVTIVGEPGVGKSRLVRELRSFVDARPELVAWRQGRCLPYGDGITFWALSEVLKAQAGILESDGPGQAGAKLAEAVAAVIEEPSERDWFTQRLSPLVGLASAPGLDTAEREEAFAAWRRFLEAVAEQSPLVVVLEDLHWADRALLAFVRHLAEWAADVPLVVVATTRPELFERAPDWGGGLRNATTVSLARLSDSDTARLVAHLLDQAVLPASTQAALLERAEGNPLYAEEVCRMLADQGGLERHGRTLRLATATEIAFPDSIQALISARLDTLAPTRKALLHDAAVVGRVFWSGALAAMGGRDPASVRDSLHELARRELVRPARRSSVEGEAEYAFWHALIRDVAYGQLPRAARASKHAAAAAWIEQVGGERVADHAEVLAHHYTTALGLAQVAGATDQPTQLQEPAYRFLVLAGDRVMNLDPDRAHAYYQRALELAASNDPERAAVLAKAAAAAFHSDQLAQADEFYEQAIAAHRTRGDLLAAGSAMERRAKVLWDRGEMARSREMLASAIQLLERRPPGAELARAYGSMAAQVSLSGLPAAALEWAAKAIALAGQVDAAEERQYALQFRGSCRCDLGDEGGLDDLRAALQLGLQLGLARPTAVAYSNLAEQLLQYQGPESALDTYQAGLDLCQQRGLQGVAVWLRSDLLDVLFVIGDWDPLLGMADEMLARSRARGRGYVDIFAESRKAHVHVLQGELVAASALAEGFLPRARAIGDPQVLVAAVPVAALVEQARGHLTAAGRLVEELHEASRHGPALYRALPLPDLVRVCAATRQLPLAARLLDGIDARAARLEHCVVTGQATLTEARGDLDEALRLYTDAAKRWTEYGSVPEQGHALFAMGRCLARIGRPGAGERLLEARAIFSGLGARPLVAETDRWLQRGAARTS